MPPVGFEPTISASERPHTYALDRAVTGTGESPRYSVSSFPDPSFLMRFYVTRATRSVHLISYDKRSSVFRYVMHSRLAVNHCHFDTTYHFLRHWSF